MANKAKRKKLLRKAMKKREEEVIKIKWRNIWVKAGVLNG
jgi:hypothetical protein